MGEGVDFFPGGPGLQEMEAISPSEMQPGGAWHPVLCSGEQAAPGQPSHGEASRSQLSVGESRLLPPSSVPAVGVMMRSQGVWEMHALHRSQCLLSM